MINSIPEGIRSIICCCDASSKTRFYFKMDKVINLGIPHVGELIFESFDTPRLIKCLEVSETWKVLAENVLIKRWKGKMFEACKSGETKVVQLLLERCNSEESGLNIKDEGGWTSLMWACFYGHKDVIQLLMDHSDRIELNARSNLGMTAFILACSIGHKDVVKLLLDHSETIELNTRYNNGVTGFILACFNGRKDVVKLLLEHSERIDLNARSNNGWNAFMWACEHGHKDVVKLFLDHSEIIDLNARDNDGETALMIACENGHKDVVKLLLEYPVVVDINIPESFQLSEEIKTILKMHSMTVQK